VLLNTATILSKQTLKKTEWQSITSLINLWREEHENDSKRQTKEQTKLKPQPAKQIPLKSQHEISDSNALLEDAPKLENRDVPESPTHLSSTLQRLRNAQGFHKVLLVGPEGSGKTHICDHIAAHFGERRNTQGMDKSFGCLRTFFKSQWNFFQDL
jgi:chromosomal replication initiation ATPase DnaA